jgi:hypothetical protein
LEVTDATLMEDAEDTVSENDKTLGESQLAPSGDITHQYLDKAEASQQFKKTEISFSCR